MLKTIKVDLTLLEYLLYFWQATSENDKVGEEYIAAIANHPHMAPLYRSDFTADMVRKALSALSNREKLSDIPEVAYRFMRNNQWVMDDMGLLGFMVAPIKVLNADALVDQVNQAGSFPYEQVEIIFVPGAEDARFSRGNRLYINFFAVQPDLYDENNVTIAGLPVLDYIHNSLLEMK